MNTCLSRNLIIALTAATTLATLTSCSDSADAAKSAGVEQITVAGAAVTKDTALHDALPDAIKKSGTVRVATDVPYAPFEMFVAEGEPELTGLDYDLGQALGAKLGVKF